MGRLCSMLFINHDSVSCKSRSVKILTLMHQDGSSLCTFSGKQIQGCSLGDIHRAHCACGSPVLLLFFCYSTIPLSYYVLLAVWKTTVAQSVYYANLIEWILLALHMSVDLKGVPILVSVIIHPSQVSEVAL